MFCPSKVIRTRESGNFKLVESGIRKISACGIRKRAQGIWNPAYTWNPESTEKESEIQHLESVLTPESQEEAWNRAWQVTSYPKSPRMTGNEAARIQDCPKLPYITFGIVTCIFELFFQKTKRKPWAYNKKYIPFSKVLYAVDISIPRENICPKQGNDAEKFVGWCPK